mmetsp:Transcript_23255/g.33804  ORF Transcript_23255/g.33804 Transcript_23255/m.33804 type:complete len:210 (+) Transcript_23255:415-1044(+)
MIQLGDESQVRQGDLAPTEKAPLPGLLQHLIHHTQLLLQLFPQLGVLALVQVLDVPGQGREKPRNFLVRFHMCIHIRVHSQRGFREEELEIVCNQAGLRVRLAVVDKAGHLPFVVLHQPLRLVVRFTGLELKLQTFVVQHQLYIMSKWAVPWRLPIWSCLGIEDHRTSCVVTFHLPLCRKFLHFSVQFRPCPNHFFVTLFLFFSIKSEK